MEDLQLIIGVIAAVGGGIGACLFAWVGWERDHPWLALAGTIVSSSGLFCGTVAAARASMWSFIVGGVLAGLTLLLLPCRIIWNRWQVQKRGRALGMWLPEGTIEGESFRQALAIALRRYGGIDDICISDLPICTLKRVFATRSPENPWLHLVEFQVECLNVVTLQNMNDFRRMAGLLIIVDPAAVEQCQQWYLQCVDVLELLISCHTDELVDAVRLMWKIDVLGQELQQDLTLNALNRLDSKRFKILRIFLLRENRKNPWIKTFLKISGTIRESSLRKFYKSPYKLKLKYWKPLGTLEECWLCSYRPPGKSFIADILYNNLRSVLSWTRRCRTCKFLTMKPKLRETPEDVGLQTLFGG